MMERVSADDRGPTVAVSAGAVPSGTVPSVLAPPCTIVMVGLMGAGKSAIGRRLANHYGWSFVDADTEIVNAAGCSIADFFARFGEQAFREGEARVIARLLAEPPCVLATGGGAFMTASTRQRIRETAISVWLKVDLDTAVRRTAGRSSRPLLNQGDPRAILSDLMDRRYPVYAEADVTVEVRDDKPEITTRRVADAVAAYIAARHPAPAQTDPADLPQQDT